VPSFPTQSFQERILPPLLLPQDMKSDSPPLGEQSPNLCMCLYVRVYMYLGVYVHTHVYTHTLNFSGFHRPGQGSQLHMGETWFRAQKVPVQSTLVTPEVIAQRFCASTVRFPMLGNLQQESRSND